MKMEKQQDYYPLGYKITYDTVEGIAVWSIMFAAILTVVLAYSLIALLAGSIVDHPRAFARKLRNITTNTIDFFKNFSPSLVNWVRGSRSSAWILPLPLNPDESIQAGGLNFFGVIACAFTICLEL
ncbi:unnamed protein product [Zymoseptoria tritici ST99CH_1E4]|uniref:Uncharacterized protein n=1 Tax=Zymoseptoria tritici ST99CH_1E4 TaxID=1276532 RepID=A0A2H1GZ53_ZYMTR|nr:unnamed protein product [Zymoseptoria tritici ST99CH_1E4]